MATNYMNAFYKQFENLSNKLDKVNNTIHKMSFDMSLLRDELKKANELNIKYLNEINELKLEIERLKNNNKLCLIRHNLLRLTYLFSKVS